MRPLDLATLEVAPRRARVHTALRDAEIDWLVVTSATNVRWLTGFTGSNATLLITDDRWELFTDTRYATQAPVELATNGLDVEVVVGGRPFDRAAAAAGSRRVGVEADHVTWATMMPLIGEHGADAFVATAGLVERLRMVKDAAELARIRAATAIVDDALAATRPALVPGVSELQLARRLDDHIRAAGAAGPAYDTIVAGGPNSALPHAFPGMRPLAPGDLVVIDVGAEVDGYRSDMTRTFVLGDPTDDQQRQLDVVLAAQEAGVAAAVSGATGADIDTAARTVIEAAGWGGEFGHGTGHGVGLDIHELPRVNRTSTDVVVANTTVTIEPGVYLPGIGGVRWEDLCLVTASGAAELLTRAPKEPIVSL